MSKRKGCLFLCMSLLLCMLSGSAAYGAEEKSAASVPVAGTGKVQTETSLFTPEEEAWLLQKEVLRVAVLDNWRPYIYKERSQAGSVYAGLAVDLFNKLKEQSGIRIEYVRASCYSDMLRLVAEGKADVAACTMENGKREDGTGTQVRSGRGDAGTGGTQAGETGEAVTKKDFVPYLESVVQLIARKNSTLYGKTGLRAARVGGTDYLNFEGSRSLSTVTDYPSMEECLEAVREKRADFAVCDIYTVAPLMNYLLVNDLAVRNVPEHYVTTGFRTASTQDGTLVAILKKTQDSMSEAEISERIFYHGERSGGSMGIVYYMYRHPIELVLAILMAFIVAAGVLSVYLRARFKQQRQMKGYEASCRMLADTFGYAGMEYDFEKDELILFGEKRGDVDIPERVEDLHEKLRKRAIRITLTEEEFDRICTQGQERTNETEFQCGMKEGGWNWFRMVYIVVYEDAAHKKPLRLVGCLMDAQKQHTTEEKLLEIGQYDRLTGIYNRAGAEGLIKKALRHLEEYSQNAFLLMDVDRFKQMNDSNGHLCGDDALRTIGRHLTEIFEGDTILCRWGGDEFLMFVRGPGAETGILKKRLEELQRRMKDYRYEDQSFPIGLSIGGVIPEKGAKLEKLFKEADEVLYEVKEKGRDGFVIREKRCS